MDDEHHEAQEAAGPNEEWERFEWFLKAILQVSKEELDEQRRIWKEQRKKKR